MTAPFPDFANEVRYDEQYLKNFMDNGFDNMFKEVYEFISQYQKPTKKGIFSKTPLKRVLTLLESVEFVLERSKAQHYHKEMIPDITNTFIAILHPLTPPEIRTIAVRLYVMIRNILEDEAEQYVEKFENLVFDFTLLPEETVNKSKLTINIDPELRIQNTDPIIRPNNSLLEHVEYVLSQVLLLKDRTSAFNCWWNIIQKRLISVAYRSVTEQINPQNASYGINGLVPWVLQKLILSFITKVFQNPEYLTCILGTANTPAYLYAILNQCATDDINHTEAFNFIINFIKLVCDNITVLDSLKKAHPIIFPHIIFCLQKLFEQTFIMNDTKADQRLNICVDTLKRTIVVFYNAFDAEAQYKLCSQLASWPEIKNINCCLHVLSILLSSSVNLKIQDPNFWNCIVNGGGCQRHTYLTAVADFASFYAFNIVDKLLKFPIPSIADAIAGIHQESDWTGENEMWLEKLLPLTVNPIDIFSFFLSNRDKLTISEIANDNSIQKVKLQPLNISEWTLEECLSNSRAFISAFDWTKFSDDIDTQFSVYLVGASFIHPLLKMTQVFPPTLEYDKNFLIKEYMAWLDKAASPKVTNKLIVVHALKILGEIMCRSEVNQILNDFQLSNFYLTLKSHIADDNMKVKQTALVYACRSILVGLRHSNILITTVCNSIQTLLIPVEGGVALSGSEKSQFCLALFSTIDISNKIDFEPKSDKNKVNCKQKLSEFCFGLNPRLRIATLIEIITEECINKRSDVTENCITSLLKSFNQRTLEDVYAFFGLLNSFPYLEKSSPGSITRVLQTFLNAIEIFNEGDEFLYFLTVMLTVESLIDSSFIIDVSQHYKHFEVIAANWSLHMENCKFTSLCQQRLDYSLLYLSYHFQRYHFPIEKDVVGGEMNDSTVFKSNEIDNILRLKKEKIVTDLPVARMTWNYKSLNPQMVDISVKPKTVLENVTIPSASDISEQQKYTKHFTDFVDDLFDNKLLNLGLKTKICQPSDFMSLLDKSPHLTSNTLQLVKAQNIPTNSSGHESASFMTSLGFFDKTNVFPSISAESSQKMKELDNKKFMHTIPARFAKLAPSLKSSELFDDFKNGLGVKTENGDIVHSSWAHSIIFNEERSIGSVLIVWGEEMNRTEIVQTFSLENPLRIEIYPTKSGLFDVRTCSIHKIAEDVVQIKRAFVTKRALPLFVVSQINSAVHAINIKDNNNHESFLSNGNMIREMKEKEFHSHYIMLLCEKKILQEVQQ
ncbi:hypothetical protein TVAG_091150 [Trichomonas vaginalis G3]|uniref:Rap-GAP domain-containing protein n=1 Tax=Trichomonas vaginalis (strain ATCC PRA-98 / G3) TaxID=412133 RepID=A2F619_TRIV3|nr:GTPase activator protein [Trichomonas vaginalis G3]EAX99648.1 hypothetical protein TVAG_091150 [Trichomonas vaginalis G3]KAI5522427.1 GTPase activator protein [Trichomonas vaginalis G3]|eukprot:XP_001312578.1 hypothetical protein [Trichomonas vaginalis G3]